MYCTLCSELMLAECLLATLHQPPMPVAALPSDTNHVKLQRRRVQPRVERSTASLTAKITRVRPFHGRRLLHVAIDASKEGHAITLAL
jgi:hypothetical protein